MNRPRRVSVTAPEGPVAARPAGPLTVGPADLAVARRVRRAQLRRASITIAMGALLLFGLPVLLRAAPGLAEARLAGVPGGWLAVAVAPFPLLAALAWWQMAGAERDERDPGDRTGRDDEVGRHR